MEVKPLLLYTHCNASALLNLGHALRRLVANNLWSGLVAQGNKKKKSSTGFSRPLRSQVVDAVKDECDFEADLVDFMDESDNDVFQDAKPFSFSTINTTFGSSSLKELGKTTTKV